VDSGRTRAQGQCGFCGQLHADQIAPDPARRLVEAALAKGARDNVTAPVIEAV